MFEIKSNRLCNRKTVSHGWMDRTNYPSKKTLAVFGEPDKLLVLDLC